MANDSESSSSGKRGREAFSRGDIGRRMEEDRERVSIFDAILSLVSDLQYTPSQ